MTNRGYTLLFSVLTAALVLGVAVFVLSASKKQYDLAVTARDSMYALYAADSAVECAYVSWGLGSLDVLVSGTANPNPDVHISCDGNRSQGGVTFAQGITSSDPRFDAALWKSGSTIDQAAGMGISFGDGRCALVTATYGSDKQKTIENGGVDVPVIRIDSLGYNQCDSATPPAPKASTRTIERGVRLTNTN